MLPHRAGRAILELAVERGVLIAEQDDQGADSEGGAEGELEEAEDGRDDGHHAAPLGVLQQAPAGGDGQGGARLLQLL